MGNAFPGTGGAGATSRYFSSKEALFTAVLEDAYLSIRAAERKLALELMEPEDALDLAAVRAYVLSAYVSFEAARADEASDAASG